MSDPLQTSRTTLSQLSLSTHPLQPLSIAAVQKLIPHDDAGPLKLRNQERAAALIERSRLDVLMQRGRKLSDKTYCADKHEVEKFSSGKDVLLSSSTAGADVRGPIPRLLWTAQEVWNVLPEVGPFPGTQPAVTSAISKKAFVGGGAHLSLQRICEYGPKRGQVIKQPPTAAEVLQALTATGRTVGGVVVERLELSWDGRASVQFNADADNGFPVGLNMRDPYARDLALSLAGGLRDRLEKAPDPLRAVQLLKDKYPEYMLLKGKTKLDLYNTGKIGAGHLRFYNTVGRQNVLIMQQATQPLADHWKEQGKDNWRTFIGKGMARGGAESLVAYLEGQVGGSDDKLVWSHAGDDTILFRARRIDGQYEYSVFSLDCTAFDLTQHSDTTEFVHKLMYTQLASVDAVSAAMWYSLMREREVTVSGSLPVRTKHWGASGMPLQSEVNDTLMEILCRRLSKETWADKKDLDEVVQSLGAGLGFRVRLEDYISMRSKHRLPAPLRWVLARRPFLFVGYHLWSDGDRVYPQIDVARFMSGMMYTQGGYVKENAELGVRVALMLAGYALSFGKPHPAYEPAHAKLKELALEALANKAREINLADAQAEVSRYVYANLGLTVDSVAGLSRAIQFSDEIWRGERYEVPRTVVESWADEPELEEWEREFVADVRRIDLGKQVNEAQSVGSKLAGKTPPTPAAVVAQREMAKQEARRQDEVVEAHFKGRKKGRDKRSGVIYEDDE